MSGQRVGGCWLEQVADQVADLATEVGDMEMGSVPDWLSLGAACVGLSGVSARQRALRSAGASLYFTVESHGLRKTSTNVTIVNQAPLPARRVCVTEWAVGRRYVTWRLRRYPRWMTGRCLTGQGYWTVEPNSTLVVEIPGCPASALAGKVRR